VSGIEGEVLTVDGAPGDAAPSAALASEAVPAASAGSSEDNE